MLALILVGLSWPIIWHFEDSAGDGEVTSTVDVVLVLLLVAVDGDDCPGGL